MVESLHYCHPDYYTPWNNHSLLILTDSHDYKQFLCSENYIVAQHNDFCKDNLPNCRYHILLCFTEPSNKVFDKLQHLHFKYTTVNCLYGFYLYYFVDNLVESKGEITDILAFGINYSKVHPDFISQPSVIKKKVLRKAIKTHHKIALSKTVGTQTVEEQLQKRIASILDSRYSLDFYRIVDAFCDHHGSFDSHNVHFCLKK